MPRKAATTACTLSSDVFETNEPWNPDELKETEHFHLQKFICLVQVTNDGATILNLLEVEHPAGRVLVELAQLQVTYFQPFYNHPII